jgi:TRAP-type C4-dicarboxylate transport system permease small subunit
MRLLKKLLEGIMRIEILLGAILVMVMVFTMVLEVIMRYIFNNSIIWVQEFVIFAFIWIVMLGGSAASMTKTHVTITTFSQFLSDRKKTMLQLLVSFIIIGVLVYLVLNLPASIAIQNKTSTSSMPINIAKGHYYSTPLLVAVILMLVTEFYYVYYELRMLAGKTVPGDYVLELRHFQRKRDLEGQL